MNRISTTDIPDIPSNSLVIEIDDSIRSRRTNATPSLNPTAPNSQSVDPFEFDNTSLPKKLATDSTINLAPSAIATGSSTLAPSMDDTKYPCPYCGVANSSSSNRSRHVTRNHKLEAAQLEMQRKEYECMICGKGFLSSILLKNHKCAGSMNNRSPMNRDKVRKHIQLVHSAATAASTYESSDSYSVDAKRNKQQNTQQSQPSASVSSAASYNSAAGTDLVRYSSQADTYTDTDLNMVVRVMPDTLINSLFHPFIRFLSIAPVTPLEQTIKQRRLETIQQEIVIKSNLKFICNILLQKQIVNNPDDLKLSHFAQVLTAQTIHDHLIKQNVKHERKYQIFLLLKKLCIFLVSKQSESSGVYLLPQNTIPAYNFVEAVAHESCSLRKQETKNRHVGIVLSQNNATSSHNSRQASNSASVHSMTNSHRSHGHSLVDSDESGDNNNGQNNALSPVVRKSNSYVPTQEELSLLAKSSLDYMKEVIQLPSILQQDKSAALLFAQYLLMSLLTLTATPRSQILKVLNMGITAASNRTASINLDEQPTVTLFYEEDHYIVRVPAALSKDRQPVVLRIPDLLTEYFNFYLKYVRGLLLPKHTTFIDLGYFFTSSIGGSKSSFVSWTNKISQLVIGREINPHNFRASVVSMYYKNTNNNSSSSSDRDMLILSQLMSHSPQVQQQYYFKVQREQESKRVNEQISQMLGVASTTIPFSTENNDQKSKLPVPELNLVTMQIESNNSSSHSGDNSCSTDSPAKSTVEIEVIDENSST